MHVWVGQVTNIIFTIIFTGEMCLKLFAMGLEVPL